MTKPTEQPTEQRTQTCPGCAASVTAAAYDIGSGPEMACPHCEWCWGADGQPLQPLRPWTPTGPGEDAR